MVTGRKCGGNRLDEGGGGQDTSRQHGKPAIGTFLFLAKQGQEHCAHKTGDNENGVEERESLMHGLDGVNTVIIVIIIIRQTTGEGGTTPTTNNNNQVGSNNRNNNDDDNDNNKNNNNQS
ncbi:hypothetical protein ASPFODRAFT_51181 [Aspergillus luchuensis CBS 106.47]|uniref:Uncharacterized protein n=1 Tax=Aspergillus luchuensis (strain CBS 106.47) TaxID=1137211 RepID=A0A1M3T6B4_ASPLC|nr:hypothetical protein ASPFODRAFT_51181 [Aspergillus luchuensis CBS 106.47]